MNPRAPKRTRRWKRREGQNPVFHCHEIVDRGDDLLALPHDIAGIVAPLMDDNPSEPLRKKEGDHGRGVVPVSKQLSAKDSKCNRGWRMGQITIRVRVWKRQMRGRSGQREMERRILLGLFWFFLFFIINL